MFNYIKNKYDLLFCLIFLMIIVILITLFSLQFSKYTSEIKQHIITTNKIDMEIINKDFLKINLYFIKLILFASIFVIITTIFYFFLSLKKHLKIIIKESKNYLDQLLEDSSEDDLFKDHNLIKLEDNVVKNIFIPNISEYHSGAFKDIIEHILNIYIFYYNILAIYKKEFIKFKDLFNDLEFNLFYFKNIINFSNVIITTVDPGGKISFINEFGCYFLGYNKNELVDNSFSKTIIPSKSSTGASFKLLFKNMLNQPDKYRYLEMENILKNGKRVWISWQNKGVFNNGKLLYIQMVGFDITDRKKLEDDLSKYWDSLEDTIDSKSKLVSELQNRIENETKIRQEIEAKFLEKTKNNVLLFDFSSIGFLQINIANNEIISANQYAASLFGYNDSHLLTANTNFKELFKNKDTYDVCIKKIKENSQLVNFEFNPQLNPDVEKYYLINSTKIDNNSQLHLGIIDITEGKLKEIKYYKAKKASDATVNAQTDFFERSSQDISNYVKGIVDITSIFGYTGCSDKQKQYLETIDSLCRYIFGLITYNLYIIGASNTKINISSQIFNLKNFINKIYISFIKEVEKNNKQIQLLIKTQIPELIEGDQKSLGLILDNIIKNSIFLSNHNNILLSISCKAIKKEKAIISFSIEEKNIIKFKAEIEKNKLLTDNKNQDDINKYYNEYSLDKAMLIARLIGTELIIEPDLNGKRRYSFEVSYNIPDRENISGKDDNYLNLNKLSLDENSLINHEKSRYIQNFSFNVSEGIKRLHFNRVLYMEILQRFVKDYEDISKHLDIVLKNEDIDSALLMIHKIKEVSNCIVAENLKQDAVKLEKAINTKNAAQYKQLIVALKRSLDIVIKDIYSL